MVVQILPYARQKTTQWGMILDKLAEGGRQAAEEDSYSLPTLKKTLNNYWSQSSKAVAAVNLNSELAGFKCPRGLLGSMPRNTVPNGIVRAVEGRHWGLRVLLCNAALPCPSLPHSLVLSPSFALFLCLLLLVSLPFCACVAGFLSLSDSLCLSLPRCRHETAHGVFSPSLHDAGVICTDRC